MILVSHYGAYKIIAKHEGFDRLSGVGLGGGFICEFQADVTDKHMALMYELASQGRVKFNGLGRDASTNQDLDPAERCSSFDTATVPDHLREEVEKALLASPDYGKAYWLYEEAAQAAPWPAYDSLVPQGRRTIELVAEKIAQVTVDMGLDPQSVIAYERDHLNRAKVIVALEDLNKAEAEEELVAA